MLSLIFLMEHLDNYNFSLPGLVSFLVIFPSFLDHELSFPCRYFGNFFTIFAFWKFYNYFIHYIHSFCHSILNSENKSQWQRLEHATLRSTRTDVKHICHIFVVEISMSTISSISCFLDLHFFLLGSKVFFLLITCSSLNMVPARPPPSCVLPLKAGLWRICIPSATTYIGA